MALIYEPRIFKRFPGVRAALSLRGETNLPYGFNMSLSVGDDAERVLANRARLATRLGFPSGRLATQRQIHGAHIEEVASGYEPSDSDALVTAEPGWLLAISVADCAPVLIYDPVRSLVAGVHSGWRGTAQNIVGATISTLGQDYGCSAEDLHLYIGPAAGQCCYEVGEDVASTFDPAYSRPIAGGKYLFDNRGAVLDQALSCGVASIQIEIDPRCTICDTSFHSFRRDGTLSGRMLAVIGLCGEQQPLEPC